MKEVKFFVCRHCGNMIEMIENHNTSVKCCGTTMERLHPNSTEASHEKHVPVLHCLNGMLTVCIGAQAHPMVPEHYIQWIYVQTENGGMRHNLQPDENPKTSFCLCNDPVVAVYAYCNIHGLWMSQI